ncbi:hypothetical protein ACQ4M3_06150 [Leptolyngbya sp. AN03gr2]|uniref:hypothetical protein n=1 Tax=unclassified Leptolyngbya TaxID=2650499 RepID=UPI003D3172D5
MKQQSRASTSTGGRSSRFGQWLGVVAIVIALYILWQIRQVLLLVFAAVVAATVLNRLVRALQRPRIKRGIAIAAFSRCFILILLQSRIIFITNRRFRSD